MSCGCESDVTVDDVVRPAASVSVEDFDGELLAYDDTSKELHAFNTTASLLWLCLDGESPLREIVEDLADAFGTALDVVEADVVDAAGGWRNRGLVELRLPDGTWDREMPEVVEVPPDQLPGPEPCEGCAEKAARRAEEAAAAARRSP